VLTVTGVVVGAVVSTNVPGPTYCTVDGPVNFVVLPFLTTESKHVPPLNEMVPMLVAGEYEETVLGQPLRAVIGTVSMQFVPLNEMVPAGLLGAPE
jgi:hypothetical protein